MAPSRAATPVSDKDDFRMTGKRRIRTSTSLAPKSDDQWPGAGEDHDHVPPAFHQGLSRHRQLAV